MKTQEYVNKYKLNESDKFNHTDFITDLTIDFLSLLEVGKATGNLKGFNNAVNAIRMKFDSVNNKTLGCIPESLWNYFFATVVVKMRENLFPKEMQKVREEKKKREEAKKRYKDWEQSQYDYFAQASYYYFLASILKIQKPLSSFVLLELQPECTVEDVNKAYRKMSMLHHPDKGGNQEKFIAITDAKNKCIAYLTNNKC